MTLQVREDHQAPETWGVDIDYTPVVKSLLVDAAGRPRKLHALVYDADDALVYPPLVLLSVDGDEEGLHLEGYGSLWHLGSQGVGPMIADREYVSGADKLSNGAFTLLAPDGTALYWVRAAEGSLWLFDDGEATNAGGYRDDDVLESDEKFPTRPGYTYRAQAAGVTGTGRLRIRTIYEGKFSPPNLWANGDLAAGADGWTPGTYSDIVYDPANSYYANWVMRCLPIPKPQLIADPGFETGTGWVDVTTPAPMSDDIDLLNDPSNAYSGSWVMRVGPVTQHQAFKNADFGDGHDYWFPSSTDAEPHFVWDVVPGDGVNGSQGMRTTGWSTAGRVGPEIIKYLRANSDGAGAEPYTVTPGETYRAEVYFRGHPGTDGSAYIAIMQPHPTVPGHDVWQLSKEIFAPPHDDNRWNILAIENITIPANRPLLNALIEVHNHSLGYWSVDHFTLTRTRGNRAKIASTTAYPVEVDTRYEVAALLRSGDAMQVGSVRVGVTLEGAGLPDQTEGEDKGSTDFVWERAAREVRPQTGYTHARPFVAAQDILGDPMYVDHITLTKLDNNRDTMIGPTMPVTPERTYKAKVKVRSGPALQRGNVRLDMRCIRAGHPDVTIPSSIQDNTENQWKEINLDVTPPSGYDSVQGRVIFTDVEGDIFYAAQFSFIDADTGSVVYDSTTDDPAGASPFVDSSAPDGAKTVRVAVLAEADSAGWTVDAVSLKRTGVTPATGNAIVVDLLTDPETGLPLSIAAGDIDCPEVIPYDVVIQNQTDRDLLERYCSVISDPPREFRVNATAPATIDVKTAAELFVDHGPDSAYPVTFLDEDPDVEDLGNPKTDVAERATVIRLFGAERQTVSGRPFLITADAQVPGAAEGDWNDNPIRRVKPVTDGTVDHHGYAQAYATDLARREAEPALSVTARLHELSEATATSLGIAHRPPFKVGDWIYVYEPAAGMEDHDNIDEVEGRTVFPRRVRVLARERSLGPSYRIVMRRSDGSTFPLPFKSSPDSTELTIGDRLPEFIDDPQGLAPGVAYLRWYQSRPR